MLLVACNKPASDSATGSTESVNRPNVSENTLKGLIVNAPGREDEVYESVSGDATAPSHPIIKGQLFKGWYTDIENINAGQFTDLTPVTKDLKLYARYEENI